MTADERLEAALNRFGETLEGLPRPDWAIQGAYRTETRWAYRTETRWAVTREALRFRYGEDRPDIEKWMIEDAVEHGNLNGDLLADYACHLSDIIDKLETALDTASRWIQCDACARCDDDKCFPAADFSCTKAKISDRVLSGVPMNKGRKLK